MINKHLITPDDVFSLARNSSKAIDKREVEVYIDEAEQLNLKPNIGTALFIRLLGDSVNTSANKELLYGGTYESCNGIASFAGIRKALAYYAYGRMLKNGGQTATRFGFVEKNSEFSEQVDYKARLAAANDATLVADSYLKECLNYLQCSKNFPEYAEKCGKGMKNRRVTIKVIGE